MRTIAYKTVDPNSIVGNSLPEGWITEWTYVDMQPEGSVDDWLQLPEDEFNALLAATNTDTALEKFQSSKNVAGTIENYQ